MTARDPAKPVRTTKPGDPPLDLNAELERSHGIITGLEQERDKARHDLAAARKVNDDLVVKVGNLKELLADRTSERDQARTEADVTAQSRDEALSALEAARRQRDEVAHEFATAAEHAEAENNELRRKHNEALTEAAGLRTEHARFAAQLRTDQAHAQRQLRAAAAELASKRYRGKALVARHAEAKGRADALAQAEARLP